MLHPELVSYFLSSRPAALLPNQWPLSALEGWVRASQGRRDNEALVFSFEGIC